MRRYLIALLFLFPIAANAYKNEPEGFRGINWGDDFAAYEEEFELSEDGDRTKVYLRKNDKLSIGGAELSKIAYGFQNGKFTSVILFAHGISNMRALKEALNEQFGRGIQPNRYIEKYWWYGSKTIISLDCNKIQDKCTAGFLSVAGMRASNEEDKKKAKEAYKDF
jgi:hypothetical protein